VGPVDAGGDVLGRRRRRACARLLAVVAAVAAGAGVLVVAASPAAAHGGAGELVVVEAEPVAPAELRITVDAVFVVDGHPAELRSLAIEGVGPDGAVLPVGEPFRPTPVEGRYEGVVVFPSAGLWNVVLTSTFPPARLETTLEVPGEGTGDDAIDTVATGGEGGGPSTTEPEEDDAVDEPDAVGATGETLVAGPAAGSADAGDGGGSTFAVIAGLAGLAAASGVFGVTVARRRSV